jgi:hypothetical protein
MTKKLYLFSRFILVFFIIFSFVGCETMGGNAALILGGATLVGLIAWVATDDSGGTSSSGSSYSSDRNIGKEIADAFKAPLQSGTYALAGTQARIRMTSIVKSGILTFTNQEGRSVQGRYDIDGNRMTVQADGYTYVYTITSETSFSGYGENWVRIGY